VPIPGCHCSRFTKGRAACCQDTAGRSGWVCAACVGDLCHFLEIYSECVCFRADSWLALQPVYQGARGVLSRYGGRQRLGRCGQSLCHFLENFAELCTKRVAFYAVTCGRRVRHGVRKARRHLHRREAASISQSFPPPYCLSMDPGYEAVVAAQLETRRLVDIANERVDDAHAFANDLAARVIQLEQLILDRTLPPFLPPPPRRAIVEELEKFRYTENETPPPPPPIPCSGD